MEKSEENPISWWRANFGEIAPVGNVLIMHRQADWLRIHSLPESKRYPDTPEEMDEVVRRNKVLASRLFSVGEQIFIFRSISHNLEDSMQLMQPSPDGHNLFRASASPDSPEDDDFFITVAEIASWPCPGFSDTVRNIADEEERMISFVSAATGNILCPYDGGTDSFTSATVSKQLSNDYATWLSSHPSGC